MSGGVPSFEGAGLSEPHEHVSGRGWAGILTIVLCCSLNSVAVPNDSFFIIVVMCQMIITVYKGGWKCIMFCLWMASQLMNLVAHE